MQWRTEKGDGDPEERRIQCFDLVALAAQWKLLATKQQTVRTVSYISSCISYIPVDMVLEKVDFKPLYQNIHIYTALDSLDELRKSYQADRKVSSSQGTIP